MTISIEGVILLLCALSYTLLQNKLIRIYGKEALLQQVVNANKKGKLSLLFYILAIPLAFVSTWISGILFIAVALIWTVPEKKIESKINNN